MSDQFQVSAPDVQIGIEKGCRGSVDSKSKIQLTVDVDSRYDAETVERRLREMGYQNIEIIIRK